MFAAALALGVHRLYKPCHSTPIMQILRLKVCILIELLQTQDSRHINSTTPASCHQIWYPRPSVHQSTRVSHLIQVLNLDFCTLSELPPSLGQLTALTTLDVEGNPYLGETFRPDNSPIPPAFPCQLSGLQSLKYINLNSCGLTTVPEVSTIKPTPCAHVSGVNIVFVESIRIGSVLPDSGY